MKPPFSQAVMLLALAPPVFRNAAGELEAHPAGYAVLRLAGGRAELAALAELLTRTGELLLRHGWRALLANAEALDGFSDEAFSWLLRHWLAQAVPQPPLLLKALVLPATARGEAAIAQLRTLAPLHTRYTYFGSEQAAHAFLATIMA